MWSAPGPFKLVEFKPGQRIVLERFDKFFLPGKPYLDKVVMNITPDAAEPDARPRARRPADDARS